MGYDLFFKRCLHCNKVYNRHNSNGKSQHCAGFLHFNMLQINLLHESCLDDLAAVNQFDEIVA